MSAGQYSLVLEQFADYNETFTIKVNGTLLDLTGVRTGSHCGTLRREGLSPVWKRTPSAAARLHGEDNRTALAVGTLMNARGLMELIIVNIGLQRGVIQSALFSMLVLMAIVTTLMASPVFEWVYGRRARKLGELGAAPLGG